MMVSRTHSVLLLFVLFLIYGGRRAAAEYCGNVTVDESLNMMFALYERETIPPNTNILIELDVHNAYILERSSTVQLLADLRMNWLDSRLEWNSSFLNCDYIGLDAERLWLPDIALLNGGASSGVSGDSEEARLQSDGTILWIKKLHVTVPCSLELRNWPKDVQRCHFRFGSRRHTADELEISVTNKNKSHWEAGAWEFISSSGSVSSIDRGGISFYVAEWILSLQRRSPAHSLVTTAVFIAVVIQLIAAALLTPPARVPLCACIALSVTLWLIAALLRMPGAASAPLSLPLMSSLLILSCLGALCAAIVQRVSQLRSSPPNFLRRLLSKVAILCKLIPNESTENAEGVCAWVAVSTLLDHILLIAGAIALLVIVCLYL